MEENKPKYEVFIVNTAQYYTLHTKKYGMRKKWQPVDQNEVRSFIPGTILEIYVKPGQDVAAGENLIKYEAMKMQTTIYAPADGVVDKICVANGDALESKDLILKLRAA